MAGRWDGARVRALRERFGLSQVKLAELIGLGRPGTVSEWEANPRRAIHALFQRELSRAEQRLERSAREA